MRVCERVAAAPTVFRFFILIGLFLCLGDMQIQLEMASDRNQELEEKSRKLANDREDLHDEILKLRSSLGVS